MLCTVGRVRHGSGSDVLYWVLWSRSVLSAGYSVGLVVTFCTVGRVRRGSGGDVLYCRQGTPWVCWWRSVLSAGYAVGLVVTFCTVGGFTVGLVVTFTTVDCSVLSTYSTVLYCRVCRGSGGDVLYCRQGTPWVWWWRSVLSVGYAVGLVGTFCTVGRVCRGSGGHVLYCRRVYRGSGGHVLYRRRIRRGPGGDVLSCR